MTVASFSPAGRCVREDDLRAGSVIAPARMRRRFARAVATQRVDLPAALVQSRSQLTDDRDRALAADIVTGTLRWQRSLDYLIEHFATRAVARLDEDVLVILRLSLYQLLHLDRVPASAVVDDAVDLTRAPEAQRHRVRNGCRSTRAQSPSPPVSSEAGRGRAIVRVRAGYLGIPIRKTRSGSSRQPTRYGLDDMERWVRFNNGRPRLCRLRKYAASDGRDAASRPLKDRHEAIRYAPDGLAVRFPANRCRPKGGPHESGLFVAGRHPSCSPRRRHSPGARARSVRRQAERRQRWRRVSGQRRAGVDVDHGAPLYVD
jgi:transcription termination factor NusB